MVSTNAKFKAINITRGNAQASIQNQKNQMGRLAKVNAARPQGSLPSNTKANLREQLKAIDKCLTIHVLPHDLEHLSCAQNLYSVVLMYMLVVFYV